MLWKEFVGCLDKLRSDIRSFRDLNAEADLRESDSIIKDIYRVLSNKNILTPVVTEASAPKPAPKAELPTGAKRSVLNSSEGTMVVMPREMPFVPHKPKLEEVLEKEVGK